MKGKVNKMVMRPVVCGGNDGNIAALKMLRFSLGVTRLDKIRN